MSLKKQKIIISCGVQGCCPTVEFKDKTVIIKDDFGCKIKLTRDQWNELAKKAKEIK